MDYNFREIEQKWQKRWVENKTYRVVEDKNKKKFYVLNMFPYPSGAGLHVGHPLGYIASNMPSRLVSILRRQPSRISTVIAVSSIRLASHSTGSAKSALAILSTTSGHNGPSSACSRATSAQHPIRLSLLSN